MTVLGDGSGLIGVCYPSGEMGRAGGPENCVRDGGLMGCKGMMGSFNLTSLLKDGAGLQGAQFFLSSLLNHECRSET